MSTNCFRKDWSNFDHILIASGSGHVRMWVFVSDSLSQRGHKEEDMRFCLWSMEYVGIQS